MAPKRKPLFWLDWVRWRTSSQTYCWLRRLLLEQSEHLILLCTIAVVEFIERRPRFRGLGKSDFVSKWQRDTHSFWTTKATIFLVRHFDKSEMTDREMHHMRNAVFSTALIVAICAVGTAAMAAKSNSNPAGGCADKMELMLVPDGWQSPKDGQPFSPDRLEAFRAVATTAFRTAADHACATVPAVRRTMAPIKSVLVNSGSGATEPTFYRDAGQFVFQYVFNESDLELPSQAAIEQGLRCFSAPKRGECADMGN